MMPRNKSKFLRILISRYASMHCLSDHFYDKASFIIIIIIWSWIYYIIHYTFEISLIFKRIECAGLAVLSAKLEYLCY